MVSYRFLWQSGQEQKKSLLELLSSINKEVNKPWCAIGDFNETLSQDEKWGGQMRHFNQIEQFRTTLAENEVHDMGWQGHKYTWSNCHRDDTFAKERLDWVVSNLKWRELLGNEKVEILSSGQSDHKPLLLTTWESTLLQRSRARIFRFEASWTKEKESFKLLTEVWKKGPDGLNCWNHLMNNLKNCNEVFTRWQQTAS